MKSDLLAVNEGFLLHSQAVSSYVQSSVFQIYSSNVLLLSIACCFSAPVTAASVQINGSQPVLNHTFTLICQTSGVVESIAWMHNGSLLYSDNRRMLSVDNATLTFNPVVMSDSGNYSCTASNAISNVTSEWLLLEIFCEYLKRCKF